MEFQEFWKQQKRMCNSVECSKCELYAVGKHCALNVTEHPKEAEEIVRKWAYEHPVQTNADKFMEVFGYKPDTGTCVIHECAREVCLGCKYKNWWNQEYKAPEEKER